MNEMKPHLAEQATCSANVELTEADVMNRENFAEILTASNATGVLAQRLECCIDILDKMDFFQGQRAGRELWNDKPFEVQEQDIADFVRDIAFVKKVIDDALALLREKDAEIEKLELTLHGVMWSVDKWLDEADYNQDQVKRAITMREKTLRIVEEKDAEIERLTAYNANLICANTDITNRHKDYVEEAERIARADAIEKVKLRLSMRFGTYTDKDMTPIKELFGLIDQIAKEMKEGEGDA